ncbi:MAG: hypothetical protein EBZ47_09560, partial [Chlamydiae bacterium]|nr:hypothetical protein [Chlamydiota bacterium]
MEPSKDQALAHFEKQNAKFYRSVSLHEKNYLLRGRGSGVFYNGQSCRRSCVQFGEILLPLFQFLRTITDYVSAGWICAIVIMMLTIVAS